MGIYTTETSVLFDTDNVIRQRQSFAYEQAATMINGGHLLELGVGIGRGMKIMCDKADKVTAIDKNEELINGLKKENPHWELIAMHMPPLAGLPDNTYDYVVLFQVIEHIKDDDLFVKEIYRVLKPGGKCFITTPNIKMTLSRNPWHEREYTVEGLKKLLSKYFTKVDMQGVYGSQKVMDYYEKNKASVARFKRLDIFNLENNLPLWAYRLPYEFLNRWQRKKLMDNDTSLVSDVTTADYRLEPANDVCLDLWAIVEK